MTFQEQNNPNTIHSEDASVRMPALFIGHGSPMNALEDNEFTESWQELARSIPRPKGILAISAHWETRGTTVTAMAKPKTIHDFGGFPRELFEYEYAAPGSPELARLVQETVEMTRIGTDQNWGLDHGTWSVLAKMYPQADIPVIQLSLDRTQAPAYHYELAKELRALRNQGVLILSSGNIVHNLSKIDFKLVQSQGSFNVKGGYDWAVEFDEAIKKAILAGDHPTVINYNKFGKAATLSVNSAEHYLPLLYTLGLQQEQDKVTFLTETLVAGSLSMRSVKIG
jgi:4,5-DOPA dioxygenase extradiol